MISIRNLSKSFSLPHLQQLSVKGSLFSFLIGGRKTYSTLEVLRDFSLDIQAGETIALMGPNGCGKSTLLKILAGVYQPDTGEVQVQGKISALLELGVGFHPDLSARDNVMINGLLLGLSRSQLDRSFQSIIRFAELEDFVDAPLKHFSSGMAARLAFAVAMQVQADVYLIDEVLAVGDASFQQKCFEVFRELKQQRKTIVLVTHSETLAEQVCDRVIRLD